MKAKTLILMLAQISVLLVAGSALAQEPVTIDWWILSSGGGVASGEGGVEVNGTLGQPVVGASSADAITLSAGDWHGHCTAAVAPTNMSIGLSGTGIRLGWDPDPANTGGYEVHRNTDPYFTPGAGSLHETVPAGTDSTVDTGAAGSTTHNYFYIVRGISECDAPSGYDKRLGEFDFGLTPGE